MEDAGLEESKALVDVKGSVANPAKAVKISASLHHSTLIEPLQVNSFRKARSLTLSRSFQIRTPKSNKRKAPARASQRAAKIRRARIVNSNSRRRSL